MNATTATPKIANYTEAQTAKMVKDYANGVTIESLAEELGKKTRSIIAKLTREGVYKAKSGYVSKTGAAVVKKEELATAIGDILGLSVNDTDSLTKATKPALVAMLAGLKRMGTHPDEVTE